MAKNNNKRKSLLQRLTDPTNLLSATNPVLGSLVNLGQNVFGGKREQEQGGSLDIGDIRGPQTPFNQGNTQSVQTMNDAPQTSRPPEAPGASSFRQERSPMESTTDPSAPSTTGAESAQADVSSVIKERAGQGSARDQLLNQLTQQGTTTQETQQPSLTERFETLQQEAGIPDLRQQVGTFEEEVGKTMDLLDQLESDITERTGEFITPEPQRRRQLAAEREPLTEQLETLQTGQQTAQSQLERQRQDVLTELGLEQTERQQEFEREQGVLDRLETQQEMAQERQGEVADIAQEAAQFGAPQDVINRIGQAGSRIEAIQEAGEFLEDPQSELDRELTRSKIQKNMVDMADAQETGEETDPAQVRQANLGFNLAENLLNHDAFSAAVGPVSEWLPSPRTLTGETKDFASRFEQLREMLTVENLDLMSGTLTDNDIQILRSAATRLDRGLPEESAREELNRIKDIFRDRIVERGGTAPGLNQEDVQEIEQEVGEGDGEFNPADLYE